MKRIQRHLALATLAALSEAATAAAGPATNGHGVLAAVDQWTSVVQADGAIRRTATHPDVATYAARHALLTPEQACDRSDGPAGESRKPPDSGASRAIDPPTNPLPPSGDVFAAAPDTADVAANVNQVVSTLAFADGWSTTATHTRTVGVAANGAPVDGPWIETGRAAPFRSRLRRI